MLMLNQSHNRLQAQFDAIDQELSRLHHRRLALQNQRARLNLLQQFKQQRATRSHYIGFQPARRR